jgi:tRNA nucleotidyltransferase (CCA-adding enzyme)
VTDRVIAPPPEVLEIARTLEAAGFETWCVGGAVRDALLGVADLDWDLATAALPKDVRRLFPRTVPVGIEHGTVGVLSADGRLHEVTTFRADVETDGRHAVVKFGVSLEEDLARRDFTINAIAWSPKLLELRDPFGGRADLHNRTLRAVGIARERMEEDRLRALRAIRFAARFSLEIEPQTWNAIVASAPFLTRLSVERVYQEWTKTLEQVHRPSIAFARWRDAGALRAVVPALSQVADEYFTAIDHVPLARRSTRPERQSLRHLTRLALPFLPLGERDARSALIALRASKHEASHVAALADAWARVGDQLARAAVTTPNPAVMRRLVAAIGRTRVHATVRTFAAVWAARRATGVPAPSSGQVSALGRRMLRAALTEPIAISDLALSGDDLREAGVPAGPRLGRTLERLLDAVLENPALNTRAALLDMVEEIAE